VLVAWLSPAFVRIDQTPAPEAVVEVRRTTPRWPSSRMAGTLTETDLDTGALECFFLWQGALNAAGARWKPTGRLVRRRRSPHLPGRPSNDRDTVNKRRMTNTAGTSISLVVAAKDSAVAVQGDVVPHAASDQG
jgi:hypothetical protein